MTLDLPAKDDPFRPLAVYLASYGESFALEQSAMARPLLAHSYRWVLVIPAYDEDTNFLEAVLQHLSFANQRHALLVICVINAPDDAPEDARRRTQRALTTANAEPHPNLPSPRPPALARHRAGIDVLSIDAATRPLPADQATGLARKIGNDIACNLMLQGQLKTALLCNTDADAILPADYFRQIAAASLSENQATPRPTGAFILSFSHHSNDSATHAAGQLYELYLRRLYLNLAGCGSPYAYPALGSVLVIDAVLYAKSRGFPKRRAGEDFYLLNKIAKLADIVYLRGNPVTLESRASHRVPFGTGPAIEKALRHRPEEFLSYSPASFALLKRFYDGFRELGDRVDARPSVRGPLWPGAWQDPDLLWLLKRLGLPTVLKKLQTNHPGKTAQRRAVHEWFDALKIVRFLNEARHFHPDEPLLGGVTGLDSDAAQTAPETNAQLEQHRSTTRHGVTHAL